LEPVDFEQILAGERMDLPSTYIPSEAKRIRIREVAAPNPILGIVMDEHVSLRKSFAVLLRASCPKTGNSDSSQSKLSVQKRSYSMLQSGAVMVAFVFNER
jgi:hypothetical protein